MGMTKNKKITIAAIALFALGLLSGPIAWDGTGYSNHSDWQLPLEECEWLWDTAELPEEQEEAARLCP